MFLFKPFVEHVLGSNTTVLLDCRCLQSNETNLFSGLLAHLGLCGDLNGMTVSLAIKRSYRKEELVNMPLRYALVVKYLLKHPVPDTLITAGAQKSELQACSERIRFYITFG